MIQEQQIKALAELDGWTFEYGFDCMYSNGKMRWSDNHGSVICGAKDYTTSYDAIIPLIQKQTKDIQRAVVVSWWQSMTVDIDDMVDQINATPAQLCKALLRATGKWTE